MATKAIIMAAGRGTRLMPLTKDRPKCLVEVNGKPILGHILEVLEEFVKFEDIIIITGYEEQKIFDYLSNEENLTFVSQTTRDGTANAIFLAFHYIWQNDFIVLSGDIIYEREDIKLLMENKNCLLYTKMYEKLYEYGTLDMEEEFLPSKPTL